MKIPEGAGGTSGGFGMFIGGIAMAGVGLYMISRSVILYANLGWSMFGYNVPFGLTLLPLLVGIGFLFFNGKSTVGWSLTGLGILFILAEVLLSIRMTIRYMSLYEGIIMFGLFAAGIGLIFRSFKAYEVKK